MDMNPGTPRDVGQKQNSDKTQSEIDTPKPTPSSTQPHQWTLQDLFIVLQPANELSEISKRIAIYIPSYGYKIFTPTPAKANSIIYKDFVRITGAEELSGLARWRCST